MSVSYYPFGLQQKGYNDVVTSNSNPVGEKIKTYQGQELNDELGLNWIQFKWRCRLPLIRTVYYSKFL
jgi:hypothetical protein